MQVNLRGPLVWIQEAWNQTMSERGGVVLNISSVGGMRIESLLGVYNVTKAGLIHLTRQLAGELGPKVRVNAIAPGLVKTEFARALWEDEKRRNERFQATPLRRLGEPRDIGGIAVVLASGAAAAHAVLGEIVRRRRCAPGRRWSLRRCSRLGRNADRQEGERLRRE